MPAIGAIASVGLVRFIYQVVKDRASKPSIELRNTEKAALFVSEAGNRSNCDITKFRVEIEVQNNGGEPAYITSASLQLSSKEEEIDVYNCTTRGGPYFEKVELRGGEPERIGLRGQQLGLKEEGPIEAELCLNTSVGQKRWNLTLS